HGERDLSRRGDPDDGQRGGPPRARGAEGARHPARGPRRRPDRGARPRRRGTHGRLPRERARARGERPVLPLLRQHGGPRLAAAPREGALQGGRQLDARRARSPGAHDGARGAREPRAAEGGLRMGRLDGKAAVVTGAGRGIGRAIAELLAEEWAAVIAVHLKGTFNCTRHAAVHMRQQRRGRIISISSTSGVYGNSGQANYGAAKDGIAGFTRVVSRDLGRYGITVNAVCPGALTRMSQTVPQSARRTRNERGLETGFEERGFPLRNFGPENVAPWVVYLATDAARDVNGQTFLVMAGLVALLGYPAPIRTIQRDARWTPEEIATIFPHTLGMDLVNPAPAKEPS